jgi:hypothetical protein
MLTRLQQELTLQSSVNRPIPEAFRERKSLTGMTQWVVMCQGETGLPANYAWDNGRACRAVHRPNRHARSLQGPR